MARTTLVLPDPLHQRLTLTAKSEGISLTRLVGDLLSKALTKERESNNLCIFHCESRNRPIVPVGQEIIKHNGQVIFEGLTHLAFGCIYFIDNVDKSFQAGLRIGLGHQFFDQFNGSENDALTSAGDMRKETMFNRIVLGAIGGIVSNPDFDTEFIS